MFCFVSELFENFWWQRYFFSRIRILKNVSQSFENRQFPILSVFSVVFDMETGVYFKKSETFVNDGAATPLLLGGGCRKQPDEKTK